jgi:xanthine dehydrogenase accessory factor
MLVLIRGGGDLASGVALRLHRVGLEVLIAELPQPLVVRRLVSFAEAVYRDQFTVEGVTAQLVQNVEGIQSALDSGKIPVIVDPDAALLKSPILWGGLEPKIVIDARMNKRPPGLSISAADFIVGLGPGFIPGENCHAAIETNRGHHLGRVLWTGSPQSDTGIPEAVARRQADRVLRAPADGILVAYAEICDQIQSGQIIAEVSNQSVRAPFKGVLRGLLHPGLRVVRGLKIGDLDPRNDPRYCTLVSDKSLAVGGGVLEAILSRSELRPHLWT